MDRLHAIIRGDVQGVNFRSSAQQKAHRLSVKGWIRNNADGSVEVISEGPRDRLESLVEFLHEGPPAARVDSIDVQWHPASGEFSKFVVRR